MEFLKMLLFVIYSIGKAIFSLIVELVPILNECKNMILKTSLLQLGVPALMIPITIVVIKFIIKKVKEY